jgi:hypothetical protein
VSNDSARDYQQDSKLPLIEQHKVAERLQHLWKEEAALIDDMDDEERELVTSGLMRLPENEDLPEDFWEAGAPDVPLEKIVSTIRSERDED